MLSISNLNYFIGERVLFESAQIHIKPKEKIGLIGLNGTGKTTLLRVIDGEITPDSGEISKRNDCTIGYLNQDLLSFDSPESIVAVAMEAFKEAVEFEIKIEHLLKQLESDYSEKLVHTLAALQEKYEALGGYTLQSQAEEILEGVGFKTSDLHRPLSEFSGGWRMRVMLAKLLLEKPSILLLDEPTNHLDLPTIQWVENYLRNYDGAVIIVSHDKVFLDNTISKIIEVNNFKLNSFPGNYSFYMKEKILRDEIQKNAFLNQQQKIKQGEQFINRFRAKATKARQVQSRVKSLERMDKIEDVKSESASITFNFRFSQQSGRHVKRLENVSKSYGKLEVLHPSTTGIERGDKIALIGANGIGKSTLLRIIANTEPHGGKVETGYNVVPSFYAQHQIEALTLENEILDELKQAGTGKLEQELRMILGCFLFSGDDVFKKIKVLSGGEKSRVALAKTLISEANFLLLDEPTNHLDIISVNILVQALQQYKGTFVLVSHDRYFISEVANKIWYIDNQLIKEYPGTYVEYEIWRKKNQSSEQTSQDQKSDSTLKKNKNKTNSSELKISNQISKLKKKLESVENEIEINEREISRTEEEMSDVEIYSNPDKLVEVNKRYENLKRILEDKNTRWEQIAEEIEELE
ncbi:MAG: ABC-F family ATP-binding cassette domain-containing protein [Cyclobacteriaceae bacterium]|nr:ABC-F family ATP-binding cassette domain-containing protein [Cyclobacteriaceae bacterium]